MNMIPFILPNSNTIAPWQYKSHQVIRPNGEEFTFEIDAFKKRCLLNGLDKIGLTLDKEDKISSFEKERSQNYPWLDGASMKVPEKIAMYPEAGINAVAA